jgi:hypothetical protein
MWWSKLVIATAPAVVIGDAVLVIGSVKLNFAFALTLAWIVGVAGMTYLISALVAVLMSYRFASTTLGITINGKTFPPVDSASYRAWCAPHSLVPEGAMRSNA